MSFTSVPEKIGAYRVVRPIGAGGMGAVFEAINETIERRVAIKVLLPEYARNAALTTRFFNEARAVNRINHPSIVQISDFGQTADGVAFIVMELLEGESLAARLRRLHGRAELSFTLQTGWQVATALAAAHAKGIVHRDLKPDNIMLVPDHVAPGGERAKLLDFGIAKLAADSRQGKTASQLIMGTPAYMSPEQCRGAGTVDDKSDVYSLGVLLFQMLCGRLPFCSEGSGELIAMHLYQEPPAIMSLAIDLPCELAELVHRLLVKDRLLRPAMREVITMLEPLLAVYSSRVPQASPTLPLSGRYLDESSLVNKSTLSQSIGQRSAGRAARLRHLAVGLGALGLVAGVGFLIWPRHAPRISQIVGQSATDPGQPTEASNALSADRSEKTMPSTAKTNVSEIEVADGGESAETAKPTPVMNSSAGHESAAVTAHTDRSDLVRPGKRAGTHRTEKASNLTAIRSGKALAGHQELQAVPPELLAAEQLASRGEWEGALQAARQPAVVGVQPERAWRVIGSAACHMRRTTLASDAFRQVSSAGKEVISRECDAMKIHLQGDGSGESDAPSEVLVVANGHLFHNRFREAIAAAFPLVKSRPAAAWLIIGQAACSLQEPVLATKARKASSPRVQEELDQACDASGLEQVQGVYNLRSR